MIDLKKARQAFKNFISQYKQDKLGYDLKVVHTYKVVDNSNKIATMMNLSEEDIEQIKSYNLAKVIDLRTAVEADEKPNTVIDNIKYLHMPIFKEKTPPNYN